MKSPRDTVIILSEVDWDYLWQRHQIFATLYAKAGCRTYYVNRLGMRYPKFSEIGYVLRRLWRSMKAPVRTDQETVCVLSPVFFPGRGLFADILNRFVFVPLFRRRLKTEGRLILHVYQPTRSTFLILKALRPDKVIYDCVQHFDEHALASAETSRLETELIRTATLVLADSSFLFEKIRACRPDVLRVPPGVDVDHFKACFRGDEIERLQRIFYYGHLRSDLDFEMMNRVARLPGCRLTVVGTIAPDVRSLLSGEIEILPKAPYADLPGILREADILLLPYRVNRFTQAIIPAKFFECFATGKPLIASSLPEFRAFSDLIHLVDEARPVEDVLARLRRTETTERARQRQKVAEGNSWEERFHSFFSGIDKASVPVNRGEAR